MDLSTYDGLIASIAGWLNRQDLVTVIPNLISLAEVDLNAKLRVQQMVATKLAVSNDDRYPLPIDWLEAETIYLAGSRELVLTSSHELRRIRGITMDKGVEATPTHYALFGGFINLGPGGVGASLEMAYYARIPALGADNQANWLLTERPDAYLYGALTHAAPYLIEDERLPTWTSFYNNAVGALNGADEKARYTGATLTRRSRGF